MNSKKDKCSGCGLCAEICPQKCLKMKKDELGFRYANIENNDKCIKCNLCKQVCHIDKVPDGKIIKTYIAQSKNDKELLESTSGGVFSVLARNILNKNGVVWGIYMNEDFSNTYICIDKEENLHKIRGSKYVECDDSVPAKEIEEQLNSNKLVLFSGTPCQVKALKTYLKMKKNRKMDKLYTVDLFCYGIQSPRMWKKYIEEINPTGKKLKKIAMRKKQPSWEIYSMSIEFSDDSKYEKIRWKDNWLKSYSKGLYNREICSNCSSKTFPKESDITLGDFWAIDNLNMPKEFERKKGISIIITNSIEGKRFIDEIKDDIKCFEVSEHVFKSIYPNLGKSNKQSDKRKEFCDMVEREGMTKSIDKYIGKEYKKMILTHVKPKFKKIKRIINKRNGRKEI